MADSTLATEVGQLFTDLRGATPKSAKARDLAISRAQLHRLETGEWNLTLSRLEQLGRSYGVRFTVTAVPAK